MLVHDGADVFHRFLEHAVRRGVGDHQAGQVGGVLLGLGHEIGYVDVAAVVAIDHHHLHVAHLRRGRVGAMCRLRDQADVAVCVTPAGMVAGDGDETGVFALRAGVRLHADGVEAGDRLQVLGQAVDHFQVALCLLERGERVHVAEFRPGDRNHLAGGIELHGAGAERDHRVVERQILVLQLLQVAQHAVFGVVRS
jgi:hypothetical protein